MKYVSQGPMLLDVHMHRPNTNSKNFMDALLAFWPGLQVVFYLFDFYDHICLTFTVFTVFILLF